MIFSLKGVLLRILLISAIFSGAFTLGKAFFNDGTSSLSTWNIQNKQNFKEKWENNLWPTSMAITINLWTRHKQSSGGPVALYGEVMEISYIVSNKQVARDKIISNNMLIINEYYNILKTDVKGLLSSSNDRESTLDAFIWQLEYRKQNAENNINMLQAQASVLTDSHNKAVAQIDSTKTTMSNNFKNFDSLWVLESIDVYQDEQMKKTEAKIYLTFINKFLSQYQYLNDYNTKLIATLESNKDVIIKNSQVVVPDSWSNLLKNLDLIYSEKEYKTEY